jgi:hypothetical protein
MVEKSMCVHLQSVSISPFPNCHFNETHFYNMKYIFIMHTYQNTNKFSPDLPENM